MQVSSSFYWTRLFETVSCRRKAVYWSVVVVTPLTLALAGLWPLKYESEIILERKLPKISSGLAAQEFDITRLTSEAQRTIALLKSRYLRERWLDAIGLPKTTLKGRERQLRRLYRSLTVQTVNYTDLFVIKVTAKTPEEASRRVTLLANLFQEWDANQNRERARSFISLLHYRLASVQDEMGVDWDALKEVRRRQSSLSFSSPEREKRLETGLSAKRKLYEDLTAELDAAERLLQDSSLFRTVLVAPATAPHKPVRSRIQLLCVATGLSFLIVLSNVFLMEAVDPRVYSPNDLAPMKLLNPLLVIPRFGHAEPMEGQMSFYLRSLADAALNAANGREPVTVQFIGTERGVGKSMLTDALTRLLMTKVPAGTVSDVRETSLTRTSTMATECYTHDASKQTATLIDAAVVRSTSVSPVKVIDSGYFGTPRLAMAEITCVVMSAGRTRLRQLKRLNWFLAAAPPHSLFFILNNVNAPGSLRGR